MTINSSISYIGNNIKRVFEDAATKVENSVRTAIETYKAAPTEEKAWILFKTFCIAVSCGIVVLAAGALLGFSWPALVCLTAATLVGVGIYAFIKYAKVPSGSVEAIRHHGVQLGQSAVNFGQSVAQAVRNHLD